MIKISLKGSNKFALVDDEYSYLLKWTWRLNSSGYAERKTSKNGKATRFFMHKYVNDTPKGFDTDHINNDKLDNRKSNLRTCTRSENQHKKSIQNNNTTGFKGVVYVKRLNKWQAQIYFKNKNIYLGLYKDIQQAATAYNQAAVRYFGEFSNLNMLGNKAERC